MSLTINPVLLAAVSACTLTPVKDSVRTAPDKIKAITQIVHMKLNILVNVDWNSIYCCKFKIDRNASLHERMFAFVERFDETSKILSSIEKITPLGKSILYDVFNHLKTLYPSLRREDLTSATILYGIEATLRFIKTGEVQHCSSDRLNASFNLIKPLLKDESNLDFLKMLLNSALATAPSQYNHLVSLNMLLVIKESIQKFLSSYKIKVTEDIHKDPLKYKSIMTEEIYEIANNWLDDAMTKSKVSNVSALTEYLFVLYPSSTDADLLTAYRFLLFCQAQDRGCPTYIIYTRINSILEDYMKKIDEMIAKSLKETSHATDLTETAAPSAAAPAEPARPAPTASVTPTEFKSSDIR